MIDPTGELSRARRAIFLLDHSLAALSHSYLEDRVVQRLRWLWLDGLFSTISAAFYGSFVVLFAAAYGANNVQIGQLTAIGSLLGMVALLPGTRATELMRGRRKAAVVLFGGIIGRLPLLGWAILPFLIKEPAAAVLAIIAFNALSGLAANFVVPPWTAMVADIVPQDIRGRYFSHRNLALNVANMVVFPLAGWLIAVANRPGAPFAGYQLVFALALGAGACATFCFARIDDPAPVKAARQRMPLARAAAALRDAPGFLGLVGCTLLWNLGLYLTATFGNLYLVHDLGADTAMVGWVTAAGSLTSILTLRWLGGLTDRKGNIWMQGVLSFLIPITPFLWAAATAPWQMLIVNGIGGILWTGYGLASFNLLLEMAPEEARPEAAALFQLVVAISATVAPILGGHIADAWGYRPNLAISGAMRFVAAFAFLWWVARPAAQRARRRAAEATGPSGA